jgi:hypothetical protein
MKMAEWLRQSMLEILYTLEWNVISQKPEYF